MKMHGAIVEDVALPLSACKHRITAGGEVRIPAYIISMLT